MAAVSCDICGGSLTMDASGNFAVCDSCGMKHTKDRVKAKAQVTTGIAKASNLPRYRDIFEAAEKGSVQDVAYFVEKGTTVNEKHTVYGRTPLHYAAMNTNVEVLKYLFSKGANVNAIEKEGMTPLHYAAKYNSNVEVLKCFISTGVSVNTKANNKDISGMTPLHYAAENNSNVEVLKYLISTGADVNAEADILDIRYTFDNTKTPLDCCYDYYNRDCTVYRSDKVKKGCEKNESFLRQLIEDQRRIERERREEEQRKKREADVNYWRGQGLCENCGGQIGGVFTKKCKSCGMTPEEAAAKAEAAQVVKNRPPSKSYVESQKRVAEMIRRRQGSS